MSGNETVCQYNYVLLDENLPLPESTESLYDDNTILPPADKSPSENIGESQHDIPDRDMAFRYSSNSSINSADQGDPVKDTVSTVQPLCLKSLPGSGPPFSLTSYPSTPGSCKRKDLQDEMVGVVAVDLSLGCVSTSLNHCPNSVSINENRKTTEVSDVVEGKYLLDAKQNEAIDQESPDQPLNVGYDHGFEEGAHDLAAVTSAEMSVNSIDEKCTVAETQLFTNDKCIFHKSGGNNKQDCVSVKAEEEDDMKVQKNDSGNVKQEDETRENKITTVQSISLKPVHLQVNIKTSRELNYGASRVVQKIAADTEVGLETVDGETLSKVVDNSDCTEFKKSEDLANTTKLSPINCDLNRPGKSDDRKIHNECASAPAPRQNIPEVQHDSRPGTEMRGCAERTDNACLEENGNILDYEQTDIVQADDLKQNTLRQSGVDGKNAYCRIWESPRIKERKTYADHDIDDDEIEGKRSYSIEDKLTSTRYNKDYVVQLKGEDFTLKYLQENGLQKPIIFQEKSGLGLRVPSENFQVCDVKQCVGSRRMLDVMDVTTQKGMEMSMKEWVRYYENPERDRLLNVISLEFSHTKLENYVESPSVVRQVDWVDTAWPQHLKDCQTEATNIIDKMKYPKVQKYCLMSVAGCYTDFHIDFGGTSVWYHVLHGEKVFWLIPPTERNFDMYEDWVLSGKQGDIFLADHILECQRVTLKPGNTFIIPSGWIHAVFTPKDSLVFGGNFVHSFNIVNQLRVTSVEERTHVPGKFKYPFFTEISWYVLERYVHSLTGKTYLEKPKLNIDLDNPTLSEKESTSPDSPLNEDLKTDVKSETGDPCSSTPKLPKRVAISLTRIDQSPPRKSASDDDSIASGQPRSPSTASALPRSVRKSSSESTSSLPDITALKVNMDDTEKDVKPCLDVSDKSGLKKKLKYVHLTKYELKGLAKLIDWLESLPANKKNVPKDLFDAGAVLRIMKKLLEEHASDDPALAASGEPVLVWPPATKKLLKMKQKAKLMASSGGMKVKAGKAGSSSIRHRRTRCKKCEPCTRNDCGECNFCKDMKKYGGPGRMKQSCISRQCLAPVLPNTALCMLCKEDHHVRDEDTGESYSTLMECGICWEIVHPNCLKQKYENLETEGVVNEDLPNSWKCPKCCCDGREGQLKSRVFKGLPKGIKPTGLETSNSAAEDTMSYLPSNEDSAPEGKRVTLKQENDRSPVKTITANSPSPSPGPSSANSQNIKPKLEASEPVVKVSPLGTKLLNGRSRKPSPGSTPEHNPESSGRERTCQERPPKQNPSPKPGSSRKKSPSVSPKSQALKPRVSPRRPLQTFVKRRASTGPVQTATAIKKRRLSSLSSSPKGRNKDVPRTRSQTVKPAKPVITRSGRTVKRSPTLRDENLSTPEVGKKRPRREGFVTHESTASTSYDLDKIEGRYHHGNTKARERGGTRGRGHKLTKKHHSRTHHHDNKEDVERDTTILEPGGGALGHGSLDMDRGQGQGQLRRKGERLDKVLLEHVQKREDKVVAQKYVVRPAPAPMKKFVKTESGEIHKLPRLLWTKVFSFLPAADLARCLSVCQSWDCWGINPDLWKHIDLSRKRIVQTHLMGIVRRQPESLNLTSVTMTQKQLKWLVERLPLLRSLTLSKCSWATISGLCTSSCPLLHTLNVSWASGLKDQCFEDLITPPVDGKPAVKNISRLHRLRELDLAGTEITDDSLELITVHLPRLQCLSLSYCTRISDKGIQILTSPRAAVQDTLRELNLNGCRQLGEVTLVSLKSCKNLRKLNITACSNIPPEKCRSFELDSLKEYKW